MALVGAFRLQRVYVYYVFIINHLLLAKLKPGQMVNIDKDPTASLNISVFTLAEDLRQNV